MTIDTGDDPAVVGAPHSRNTVPIATLTGLNDPAAMAFAPNGSLYVIDGASVREFAPGATTPTATLTGLSNPSALAFDSGGDLYVANEANNTISLVTPAVVVTKSTGPMGSRPK